MTRLGIKILLGLIALILETHPVCHAKEVIVPRMPLYLVDGSEQHNRIASCTYPDEDIAEKVFNYVTRNTYVRKWQVNFDPYSFNKVIGFTIATKPDQNDQDAKGTLQSWCESHGGTWQPDG